MRAASEDSPTFVDHIHRTLAGAWRDATGEEPPAESTAFAAACWRMACWLNESEPPYGIEDIMVVCHARTWAAKRVAWENPPLLLCNYDGGSKRRLFWLVDRATAEKAGEAA